MLKKNDKINGNNKKNKLAKALQQNLLRRKQKEPQCQLLNGEDN